MALDNPTAIVEAGVAAQASVDKHLALAYRAAKKLTAVTEAGIAQGMVRGIAAKKILGDCRAAQGHIGAVAAVFAQLHHVQTEASVAAGADLGSVTTAGGIAIGGVSTMGGGR